jgi:hypothetical protein
MLITPELSSQAPFQAAISLNKKMLNQRQRVLIFFSSSYFLGLSATSVSPISEDSDEVIFEERRSNRGVWGLCRLQSVPDAQGTFHRKVFLCRTTKIDKYHS